MSEAGRMRERTDVGDISDGWLEESSELVLGEMFEERVLVLRSGG